MPLVRCEATKTGGGWALWRIEETEEELAFAALESCPEDIIAPAKRKEYLAGRALMKELAERVELTYTGIRKDDHGKPYLKDLSCEISLSHSTPYVAAQLHPSHAVGIDIEQPKEKLLRIASRVLSPREEGDAGMSVVKHCVYWCAKEAMYKIYGKRGLHFNSQLNVDPFELSRSGFIQGTITSPDGVAKIGLEYLVEDDFVLVFRR